MRSRALSAVTSASGSSRCRRFGATLVWRMVGADAEAAAVFDVDEFLSGRVERP
jgi:hypothetical protein